MECLLSNQITQSEQNVVRLPLLTSISDPRRSLNAKKQNVFIMGKMTKLKQNPEVGKIIFQTKKEAGKRQ